MKKYEIYIGSDNIEVLKEEEYKSIVSAILERLQQKQRNFSLEEVIGGYVFEDGTYIIEPSLKFTFIDNYQEELFVEAIKEVKKKFNQESIMVLATDIDREYVQ